MAAMADEATLVNDAAGAVAGNDGAEEDEYAQTYTELSALQAAGVAAADLKKLAEGGYHTANALLMTPSKDLEAVKGLSEAKIQKIREAAQQVIPAWQCGSNRFSLASEVIRQREGQIVRISTGSTQFDAILGGGIETKALTEIHGESNQGKTQLCYTIAAASMLPPGEGEPAWKPGRVVWIDTEGSSNMNRIGEIAEERWSLDKSSVLENVMYARPFTTQQLEELLVQVAALCCQDQVRTVIVDSIINLFRTEFNGRGELAERQQRLKTFLSKLKKLSEEHNVAVVYTNQVSAKPDAMSFGPAFAPVGGHILFHAGTFRVQMKRGRAGMKVACLENSPHLPAGTAEVQITVGGIQDADPGPRRAWCGYLTHAKAGSGERLVWSGGMPALLDLPPACLELILDRLDAGALLKARATCRRLRVAARGVTTIKLADRSKTLAKRACSADDVAAGRQLAERVSSRALGEARAAAFVLRCFDASVITQLALPCAGGCFDARELKAHSARPRVPLLTVTLVRSLLAALPNLAIATVPVEVGPSRFMKARHEDRLAYDLYALCAGTDRAPDAKRVDVRVDLRVRFASARLAALLCGDTLPASAPPPRPASASSASSSSASSSSAAAGIDARETSHAVDQPHTVAVFNTGAVHRFTCHLPSPSHLTALGRSIAACPSLNSLKVKPWGLRAPGPRLSPAAQQLGWACALSGVRVLDLTACGLGPKGFVALARGLSAGRAAQHLRAFLVGQREGPARASGRCGDAGAAALADALVRPSWSGLEFFCVAHAGVTDAGAHAVARAVEARIACGEPTALRQVSLKGNVLSKNVQHHIATLNRAIAIGSISLAADDADAGWWELEEEKMEKEF